LEIRARSRNELHGLHAAMRKTHRPANKVCRDKHSRLNMPHAATQTIPRLVRKHRRNARSIVSDVVPIARPAYAARVMAITSDDEAETLNRVFARGQSRSISRDSRIDVARSSDFSSAPSVRKRERESDSRFLKSCLLSRMTRYASTKHFPAMDIVRLIIGR